MCLAPNLPEVFQIEEFKGVIPEVELTARSDTRGFLAKKT